MLFSKFIKPKPPTDPEFAPPPPTEGFDAEVHDEVKKQKVVMLNYLVAVFAAFGSFLFGYDSGIIGSVISPEFDHFHDYFNAPLPRVTGAIVSVFAGGAFFGAIGGGMCANTLGRKRTIQLGSLIAAFGCALQTGARSIGMLIGGRFVAGLAIGMLSMIVPLYQAEISPPHARGLLSGWTQMMISTGFFSANWIGYGCQFLKNDAQWRLPLGIQIIPAVLLGFGMFFLPYSPRWLAQEGRHEEALASLQLLHGKSADPVVVRQEYEEIVTQMEWERENVSSNFRDLWATKASFHRLMCGFLVQVGSQFSGVNVNTYFGPTIYKQLGFSGNRILLINGISGALGMVWTFIFITFMADRIGRRQPLIYGACGMGICMAWQAGCTSAFSGGKIGGSGPGIAAVAGMFVFSMVFSFSYGPIAWIYQSEVFSMPLRAMGSSVSTCGNWATNVLLSQVSPIGLDIIEWKYFLVFMCCNFGNAVIAYFVYPETKGLTLEEMGLLFGDDDVVSRPPKAAKYGIDDSAIGSITEDEKKKAAADAEPNSQHLETV